MQRTSERTCAAAALTLLAGSLLCVSPAAPQKAIPTQTHSIKPCPGLHGAHTLMDAGRKAVEVQVRMDVDVDGAPNAYGPPGSKALDIDRHARAPRDSKHPGEIVGYMTEYPGGPPTVQKRGDPYPGYFVSQTAFFDRRNHRMEDPRRYVDAARVNYVVLGKAARQAGVQLGDIALVYSCRTGKSAFAIVGDDGNESGAEGSLALVKALGYNIRDGIRDSIQDREIVVRYYPRTNPAKVFPRTQADVEALAIRLRIGGAKSSVWR
jgi:hypothetical protein